MEYTLSNRSRKRLLGDIDYLLGDIDYLLRDIDYLLGDIHYLLSLETLIQLKLNRYSCFIMLDKLISFLSDNKTWLLYGIILVVSLGLVYIYVKKYFVLMHENENCDLRDECKLLRMELNKSKGTVQQLNNKINDINTRVRYGQISPTGRRDPTGVPASGATGLPFSFECMENTPLYNIIGPHLMGAVVCEDEPTPTNRPVENLTVSEDGDLVQEMSEPDDGEVRTNCRIIEPSDSEPNQSVDLSSEGDVIDEHCDEPAKFSIQQSIMDGDSLVSGDLILGGDGEATPALPHQPSPKSLAPLSTVNAIKDKSLELPLRKKRLTLMKKNADT